MCVFEVNTCFLIHTNCLQPSALNIIDLLFAVGCLLSVFRQNVKHVPPMVTHLNFANERATATTTTTTTGTTRHTGKATKGKVQDIGEVNKVMPLPLPSSVE